MGTHASQGNHAPNGIRHVKKLASSIRHSATINICDVVLAVQLLSRYCRYAWLPFVKYIHVIVLFATRAAICIFEQLGLRQPGPAKMNESKANTAVAVIHECIVT